MREQYPEEMTVVLQHQFWDLAVSDTHFEVALSFNGVSEKLVVPLDAIKGFFDPSVQFGLQFETQGEADKAAPAETPAEEKAAKPRRKPVAVEEPPAAIGPAEPAKPAPEKKRRPSSRRTMRPSPPSPAAPKSCGSTGSGRNS